MAELGTHLGFKPANLSGGYIPLQVVLCRMCEVCLLEGHTGDVNEAKLHVAVFAPSTAERNVLKN